MHDAITKGNNEMVKLLLDADPNLSLKNENGFSCLQLAAFKGNVEYVFNTFRLQIFVLYGQMSSLQGS